MSNMDKTSTSTKLRGNDSRRYNTQFQSYSDADVATNSAVSDSFSSRELNTVQNNSMPVLISKQHQSKCGGRGIIMKQLLEESKNNNSNSFVKTSKLDFSNAKIEQHFKQLKAENERTLQEKNEMKWATKFKSNKLS